jgi:predicted ATPase
VQLQTLGGLALEGSALTRPKPLLVLTYLTLEGAAPRRTLAELFFGDAADPRDSLSTALRHLRTAGVLGELPDERLGSLVEADATRLLRDFDAYRYQAVVDAYVGPFLDGLEVGLGVEAEEWLFAMREAIAGRVRTAHVHLTRSGLLSERREHARQQLTRAVAVPAAGEWEADELGDVVGLAEHLGLPESAALRALATGYGITVSRPGEGDSPRRDTTSTSLHRSTRFVGRSQEIARVVALLDDPGTRLVTLFGLGGIGKTRLAVRVAEIVGSGGRPRFADGVVTVALESVEREADVPTSIALRLGLLPAAAVTLDDLVGVLRSMRVLIVLDNVEHLPAIDRLLADLVRRCDGTVLLVTSRRRLGLDAEHAVDLAGLSTTTAADGASDAATLFLDRAARVRGSSGEVELDLAEVEALCHGLAGHPLAVELAAGMTRVLDVVEVHRLVDDGLDVLEGGPVDAPVRHRAVRAALDPTWELLDDRDRHVLKRLSRFRGTFALDAAVTVAGAGLPQLTRLVDRALLRSQAGGRGRFALHPLVRSFARERLGADEVSATDLAHRTFFERSLSEVAARMRHEPSNVIERLSADLADIIAAMRASLDVGAVEAAASMCVAVVVEADLLQARGPNRQLVDIAHEVAGAAARQGSWDHAERLFTKLANLARVVDRDPAGSVALYRQALELAQRAGDTTRQAMLHAILGAVLSDVGDRSADGHLASAEQLAKMSGDDLTECEVIQRLSYVALRRKDWALARDLADRGVQAAERLLVGVAEHRARATSLLFFLLLNLGTSEDETGQVEASLLPRGRALGLAVDQGQLRWTAYAHHELARGLIALGRTHAAMDHAEAARAAYESVGASTELQALDQEMSGWVAGARGASGASR